MFNVQTLESCENRRSARPAKSFLLQYLVIYKFIYPEFFVLTTGKCIQSVTNSKGITNYQKNTIFGKTTVTMETILCSRILQIVSTKYLIYTRECLKLIDEVIKFIN
jgi:hypothetical protein